jgi:hypothetical protein
MKARAIIHGAWSFAAPTAASVPSGKAARFVVVMHDHPGYQQEQNQHIERQTDDDQGPQAAWIDGRGDNGFFGGSGGCIGHKEKRIGLQDELNFYWSDCSHYQ